MGDVSLGPRTMGDNTGRRGGSEEGKEAQTSRLVPSRDGGPDPTVLAAVS